MASELNETVVFRFDGGMEKSFYLAGSNSFRRLKIGEPGDEKPGGEGTPHVLLRSAMMPLQRNGDSALVTGLHSRKDAARYNSNVGVGWSHSVNTSKPKRVLAQMRDHVSETHDVSPLSSNAAMSGKAGVKTYGYGFTATDRNTGQVHRFHAASRSQSPDAYSISVRKALRVAGLMKGISPTYHDMHMATGGNATKYFTHDEMSLPQDGGNQVTSHLPDLMKHAAAHKEHMDEIIDHGDGVASRLGFHHVDGRAPNEDDFNKGRKAGGMVVTVGLKAEESIRRKLGTQYGGDAGRLKDISRATIAVSHPDDMPAITHKLREAGMQYGQRPNDRFSNPTSAGYVDMQAEVHHPGTGHKGELQLHTLDHLEAKEIGFPGHAGGIPGHKMYEELRTLPKTGGTPEQQIRVDHLNKESGKLYSEATRRSLTRTPVLHQGAPTMGMGEDGKIAHLDMGTRQNGVVSKAVIRAGIGYPNRRRKPMITTKLDAGNLTKGHYKFDGMAIHVPKDFGYPQVHEAKGIEPLHSDAIPEFMHDATPISEERFHALVRSFSKH